MQSTSEGLTFCTQAAMLSHHAIRRQLCVFKSLQSLQPSRVETCTILGKWAHVQHTGLLHFGLRPSYTDRLHSRKTAVKQQ